MIGMVKKIPPINFTCTYLSGVVLMIIKHDKIRSYCMVRRFKALISLIDGLQNYEFGNEITESVNFTQITNEWNVSECFQCLQASQTLPSAY